MCEYRCQFLCEDSLAGWAGAVFAEKVLELRHAPTPTKVCGAQNHTGAPIGRQVARPEARLIRSRVLTPAARAGTSAGTLAGLLVPGGSIGCQWP